MTVFTIGYKGLDIKDCMSPLSEHGIETVVDSIHCHFLNCWPSSTMRNGTGNKRRMAPLWAMPATQDVSTYCALGEG